MHDRCDFSILEARLLFLGLQVEALIRTLERVYSPGHSLPLSLVEFHGRRCSMQLAPLVLFDSEKVLGHLAPVKPNGEPDNDVQVSVTSSDPTQVGVELVEANGHSFWLLTPLDTGMATITMSAPGYNPTTVDVSYSPGQPRELNAQFDAPISDLL